MHAQDYPARPLRWIVPVPAGSTGDLITRLVAKRMSEHWGQPIVVDNRAGGALIIGSSMIAKAPADGYTVGTLLTPHVVNPSVLKDLPYDTLRDFTAVSLMVIVPNVMTMHPGVPAGNLKDVVALAKARPGKLSYGVPGVLTSGHLSMEMFKLAAGIDITYIPYKGGAPAITDLIAGQIQFLISGPPGVAQHIASGRLKAVATTAAQRLPGLMDVPTFAESGFPGFDTYGWYGLFAPAKLPKDVLAKLNQEVARVVKLPEFNAQFTAQGAIPVGNTTQEFSAFIQREMKTWGEVARKVKLQPE
ncbi:MAG: tripartite tricarboxylate transporter substrate binding protein [Burkholderiales bacterium]